MTPPLTIRRRCCCGDFLTVSVRPGDGFAQRCADLFDAEHAGCTSTGPALSRRLAEQGDTPDPLFDLETT